MKYNHLLNQITPSASMKIGLGAQASQYVNFAIGMPDIPPPAEIAEIVASRVKTIKYPYTPAAGTPAARKNMAHLLSDERIEILPEQILLCEGAKYGLYLSLKTICNAQDKVLLLEPYWLSYPNIISALNLNKVVLKPEFQANGVLDYNVEEIIKTAVDKQVSVVIINNPNNPSGQVINNDAIKGIAKELRKHQIWLLIDEVYKDLVYDKTAYGSFNIDEENVIRIGSFSKSLCIPGLRLGYISGAEKVLDKILLFNQHIQTCVNSFSLAIAENISKATLLKHSEYCSQIYSARYLALKECLKNTELKLLDCKSSFYAFIDFGFHFDHAEKACEFLTQKHQVLATPGHEYGDSFKTYVRLCLTLPEEIITATIKSIVNENF